MSYWVGGWTALVPVKGLGVAKSRLDLPAERRAAIALAMATDVVAAVGAAHAVRRVLVITDDQAARDAVEGQAIVIADEPGDGLSAALRHGASIAAARWPDDGVVAVAADLPALTTVALDAVLAHCQPGRSLVADLAGVGTVLLAATPGVALSPAYEGLSREAHRAGGAVDLTSYADEGLRRDVDTVGDLHGAAVLGIGPATRAALDR
jgi:2-phospho-L-lactate guanylyltransferase